MRSSGIRFADGLSSILCRRGEDIHGVFETHVARRADSTGHRCSKREVIWIYVGDSGGVCNGICKACMNTVSNIATIVIVMGNHTVITTGIFKTTGLKKNRVSQESVQSLLNQRILSLQIVAAIAVVLNLQS